MNPLLSVIVPVYNTKKYLRECVDSILAQTYKNYEIILVDDGSTDGSAEICDEYADKYDVISVIHKENCGLLHTRKVGFLAAKGIYISYIDSDDFIEPGMYDHMMSKIIENNAEIATCNIVFDRDGKEIPLSAYDKEGFYNKEMLESEIYPYMLFSMKKKKTGLIPSLCNKIFKKSVLEDVLMATDNSISYGEDALCFYPCLLDVDSIYISEDKFFYHYRQIESSLTNVYDKKMFEKFDLLVNYLGEEFKKRDFDGEGQLNCYAARGANECIHKELLYNKSQSLNERIKVAKEFASIPRIKTAIKFALRQNFDLNMKIKLFLISHNWLFLLYTILKYKQVFFGVK